VSFVQVNQRPASLRDVPMHYCPGCTHGIAHRLIAEVIDELGLRGRAIGVASVGCSVFSYEYFDLDFQQAAHGRAPAVATGIKRVHPQSVVFTYQGDGDLAAIGTAEIVHAAARGENITVIFINNAVYGMTGGQMAPTTPLGVCTTSSPWGRSAPSTGYPLKITEMLATLPGATYLARVALSRPAHVAKAKRAFKKAFETQLQGQGFAMVEALSTCPVAWRVTPEEATGWLEENLMPLYPLGEIKNVSAAPKSESHA